jgi:hypothetical protein
VTTIDACTDIEIILPPDLFKKTGENNAKLVRGDEVPGIPFEKLGKDNPIL